MTWILLLAVALIGCGEDCPTGPGGAAIALVSAVDAESSRENPPEWEGGDPDLCYDCWLFYPIILVTDLQGSPLANTRVDWEILDWTTNDGETTEGEVILVQHSTLTNTQGKTAALVYYPALGSHWVETIQLKATVFGHSASIVIDFAI